MFNFILNDKKTFDLSCEKNYFLILTYFYPVLIRIVGIIKKKKEVKFNFYLTTQTFIYFDLYFNLKVHFSC